MTLVLARLAFVLFAFGPALAPAASHAGPLDRRELEARQDFAEARYDDALKLFAALFAETGDPIHLRNLARCHQKLRQPTEAIAGFRDYLAKGRDISSSERRQIGSFIAEMEALQAARREGAASAATEREARETKEPFVPRARTTTPPPFVNAAHATTTRAASPAAEDRLVARKVALAAPPPREVVTLPAPAPAPSHDHPVLRKAGLASVAAGVALVGLGIAFGMGARDAARDVQSQYDEAREAEGKRDERLQWVAYCSGAAALALGGTLLVSTHFADARSANASVGGGRAMTVAVGAPF